MILRLLKQKKLVIGAILILIIGGSTVYFQSNKNGTKNLLSAKVKRSDIEKTLTLSGNINVEEKTTLRFQTSGRLTYVGVKEGDFVKKNQLVAMLDQRTVKKSLEKDLNDYLKTRWDFEQDKDDNKYSVITDSVKRILEKSQFDLNNAVLDVELQSLAVEYSKLFSPIEGIVTSVATPYAGVNITPTQAEIVIMNPKTIYLSAQADQDEIITIKEGMTGKLILDSYPNEEVQGTINKIAFTPSQGETGTVYEVKISIPFDNSGSKFRLGMSGDITFVTEKKSNVLHIPVKFVFEENNKSYVNILKDKKKIKQPVKTGLETDEDFEITSGLADGDTIYD
ncbi:hypothetical protein A3C23_02900 [Candidatus Roizmanbacteria bacterium RIFCSPHIGHO2_02_FULL_37_13b]|uniref:LcnD-like C-terminal domain-containing protein n=1 Tax=Candidatus Roizmanbacteria bacterium RIFCSPLOWO2_02_FULL_36_11 TaxID=1802071 RepID=A0A1F7JI78_9BACT|nr:MAG: hypothetical protein A3C23_02900 [Candidatus Roizmanbacteria bacterium RIFCSPHIGHO2_02_FULL_37_13b]OGK55305.1 MAG: hypothetical protein A3H78_04330 [Candidatus Roizmanbacteria bacterium RIFCSPLOWO2_02_FULL_36_11]